MLVAYESVKLLMVASQVNLSGGQKARGMILAMLGITCLISFSQSLLREPFTLVHLSFC